MAAWLIQVVFFVNQMMLIDWTSCYGVRWSQLMGSINEGKRPSSCLRGWSVMESNQVKWRCWACCLPVAIMEYSKLICNKYSMEPTLRHYTCVMDLLGRSGCLDKAGALIKSMPISADAVIWKTLQSFVKLPPIDVILRRLFLFVFMGVWSVLNSAETGPAFQVYPCEALILILVLVFALLFGLILGLNFVMTNERKVLCLKSGFQDVCYRLSSVISSICRMEWAFLSVWKWKHTLHSDVLINLAFWIAGSLLTTACQCFINLRLKSICYVNRKKKNQM